MGMVCSSEHVGSAGRWDMAMGNMPWIEEAYDPSEWDWMGMVERPVTSKSD